MSAQPGPSTAEVLRDMAEQAGRRRIVVFREPGELGTVVPLERAFMLPAESLGLSESGAYRMPGGDGPQLAALPGLAMAIIAADAIDETAALLQDPGVLAVLDDQVVGIPEELDGVPADILQSAAMTAAQPIQGLSEALLQVGIGPDYRLTGENVTVAVIDTGLDVSHPDHLQRLLAADFRDFTDSASPRPIDDHGHGTHCAGILVGPRTATGGYGVAPGARLVVGRALRRNGSIATGLLSDVLLAAEWALRRGARIICMSLGIRSVPGAPFDPALVAAAQQLFDRGVILVAAAGNDSKRGHVPPYTISLRQPAAWGWPPVVSVAALDRHERVTAFSNAGARLVISAPGTDVHSSWPQAFGGPYARASGTSQACPLVCGLLALDLQRNPQLSARLAVDNLKRRAAPLPQFHANDVGAGCARAP